MRPVSRLILVLPPLVLAACGTSSVVPVSGGASPAEVHRSPGLHAAAVTVFEGDRSYRDFELACETSGTLHVNSGTKVRPIAGPSASATVDGPCTVVLGPSGSLEFYEVGLTFTGPFAVQSSTKGVVLFNEAFISAPSVSIDFSAAPDSDIKLNEALVRATAGDLDLRVGADGEVQIQKRPGQRASGDSLFASGALRISGGPKFIGEFREATLRGTAALDITLNGDESLLKGEFAQLLADQGNVSIRGTGSKATVEFTRVGLASTAGTASVVLAGTESMFKGVLGSVSGTHGVRIEAGEGAGRWGGQVLLAEWGLSAPSGAVSVLASLAADKGLVKVEKSGDIVGQDVTFASGTLGTTEVVGNRITASGTVRVSTGPQGNCKAELNTVDAANVQTCL